MTNETVFWYYKSNVNPWPNLSTADSDQAEWTKYRDLEIDRIEEAYQKNQSFVLLDRYRIDFQHVIQIKLSDETKQRPIKREKGSTRIKSLRESRFSSSLPVTSSPSPPPSCGSFDSWCPFLTAWFNSPSGKRAFLNFSSCIEACAQGIVQEAALNNSYSITEASHMAEKIRQCLGKSRIEVAKQCIHFYTKDSFLYYVLNRALREEDYSKLETLGPFCYLIRNYSRVATYYIGTVYRAWPAFASTSKNRQMAEMFGNTLLIIEITDVKLSAPRAYDIAHISNYPDEEEVLLPAGVSFQTVKVEQDASQKYIIFIKM